MTTARPLRNLPLLLPCAAAFGSTSIGTAERYPAAARRRPDRNPSRASRAPRPRQPSLAGRGLAECLVAATRQLADHEMHRPDELDGLASGERDAGREQLVDGVDL